MYIFSAVMAAVNFALLRIFCSVLFFLIAFHYLIIYTITSVYLWKIRLKFYFLLGTKIQRINHGYNFKLLSAITPETKNGNIVFSLFYLFIGVDNNFLLTWREGTLESIGPRS